MSTVAGESEDGEDCEEDDNERDARLREEALRARAAELMERKRLRGWVYERAPESKVVDKEEQERQEAIKGEVAALKESIETDKILKSAERAEEEEERRQGRKAEVARIHARARDLAEARFEREKREQEEAVAKAVEDEILRASKLEEKGSVEEMQATKTERDVMEESESTRSERWLSSSSSDRQIGAVTAPATN